ncbi:MAG: T9SS type A sorting domain-containing protein [Bacteroidales bacterium]|nr:T9SS type A sorting domain-containing protein [Bacteroidales bacterium]
MKSLILIFLFSISLYASSQIPGSLNSAFSGNGWDTIYGNNNGFEITKILVQSDEKLLVCAEANFSNEGHQAVILRYRTDGTPDPNFGGGDGMVRSKDDPGINLYTRAAGISQQSTGKIIVAGDQFYNTERIFRLNPDGSLDATFGTDGVVDLNRPNSEFIYKVAVLSDDRIIVCGKESRFVAGVMVPHVFLWKFLPDGALDMSFGNSGVVSYYLAEWAMTSEAYLVINELLVSPNNDILVNQSFTNYPYNHVTISKMNDDGSFDNSFGNEGFYTRSVKSNDGNYTYSSSALQEDGSVISTLTMRDTVNMTYTETVFRINASGQNDPSLNINTGIADFYPVKTKLGVSDNLIYYCRKSEYQTGYSFDVLHCYYLNGSPVVGFGNAGIALIDQNGIPASTQGDMTIDGNGRIFISSGTPDPLSSDNSLILTSQITGAVNNVSANEQLLATEWSVYPNPSSDFVYIKGITEEFKTARLEVKNSIGQIMITNPDYKLNEAINLGNIPSGLYFICLYSETKTSKFIVIKR